jgi:hypothetical protein
LEVGPAGFTRRAFSFAKKIIKKFTVVNFLMIFGDNFATQNEYLSFCCLGADGGEDSFLVPYRR